MMGKTWSELMAETLQEWNNRWDRTFQKKWEEDAEKLFSEYCKTIDDRYISVLWKDLAEETQEAWVLVAKKAYEMYN